MRPPFSISAGRLTRKAEENSCSEKGEREKKGGRRWRAGTWGIVGREKGERGELERGRREEEKVGEVEEERTRLGERGVEVGG